MAEENNEKDNSINQGEVETPNTTNEKDNSKKSESPEEKANAQRDRLYARLKKEEKASEDLRAKLKEAEKNSSSRGFDAKFIADATSAFTGLDEKARNRLIVESKQQEKSLGEARQSEDYAFWLESYRAKKKTEQTPEPSTKMDMKDNSSKGQVQKFKSGTMDKEEKRKFLLKLGVIKDYSKPNRPNASINPTARG